MKILYRILIIGIIVSWSIQSIIYFNNGYLLLGLLLATLSFLCYAIGELTKHTVKLKFLFAWYDMWVGFFWDSKKKWLYVFPIPMFGFVLKFEKFTTHLDI